MIILSIFILNYIAPGSSDGLIDSFTLLSDGDSLGVFKFEFESDIFTFKLGGFRLECREGRREELFKLAITKSADTDIPFKFGGFRLLPPD